MAAMTPEDVASVETIKRLSAALATRSTEMTKFQAYYDGEQGKRWSGTSWNELFARRFEGFCENFCGLVVDAVADRLEVTGFRFPTEGKADDETDKDAWRIWQDNQLDAEGSVLNTEALTKGLVHVLVSPFPGDYVGTSPSITVEDALETIVEYQAGTKRRVVGMKRWVDEIEKRTFVTLYYPDRLEKWQSGIRRWANQYSSGVQMLDAWERRTIPDEPWPLPHTLGVVPLIPVRNRPGLNGRFASELKQVTPIQDAINTLAMNEMVASESAAFRQKWATGIEIPVDPETGKPIKAWQPDIKGILSTPAPDAKFGTLEASELAQYGDSIDRHIQRLASISQTPYHFFLQHSGQPPAAASLTASEVPLVQKAKRRQREFGEPLEEVMRLAFKVQGDARADVTNAETVWRDPESVTEAAHIDATTKKRAIKVPLKQLWSDAGYTPAQTERFPAMLREEAEMLKGTLVAPIDPEGPAEEQIQERVSA